MKNYSFAMAILIIFSGCSTAQQLDLIDTMKFKKYETYKYFDIVVPSFYISVDSAGGVDLNFKIYNASNKTIKYIYMLTIPYNAVGDIQTCEIKGHADQEIQFTGPIASKEWSRYNFSGIWYNKTIDRVFVKLIEIDFMDGTHASSEKLDLIKIINPE